MCFFSSDPILEGCVGSAAHSHAIRQFPYRTKGTNKKVKKKRIEVKDYGVAVKKKRICLCKSFQETISLTLNYNTK